jgi:preprotein translocase subunit SecD
MNMTLFQRKIALAVVFFVAILFLIPTAFREQLGDKWPFSRPISLGLDLSGGVHLVYEVQTKEAVKSRLQSIGNNIKGDLRKEKIAVLRSKALDNNQLEVVVLNDAVVERAKDKIATEYHELQFVEKGADGDRPRLIYGISEPEAKKIESLSVDQAIDTLRNRVDQFGVAEPLIQRQGTDRILLQMPGQKDIEKVKAVVGSVAKLEFRFVANPGGSSDEGTITLKRKEGGTVKVEDQLMMTGDAVSDAQPSVSPGHVEVMLHLTSDGARTFRQITGDNVGRELAIILDNSVFSAPRINEAIPNGQAVISGGFTVEEAKQLSVILRSGALPAPLKVVEERTVGPSLGKESIRKGILAILGGFVAIMIFMVWYYKKAGVLAVATLALNMTLLIAALSFFGATLTLPGLAGLALSIGMAVDSNVIIFERIRDEIKNGATRDFAVSKGFDKAFSAIIDTNITVLISGIILYMIGTGSIKGFAVTLVVGVATTLFCAVFASRVGFDSFSLKNKDGNLSIG